MEPKCVRNPPGKVAAKEKKKTLKPLWFQGSACRETRLRSKRQPGF
jgi:hypothetical protein